MGLLGVGLLWRLAKDYCGVGGPLSDGPLSSYFGLVREKDSGAAQHLTNLLCLHLNFKLTSCHVLYMDQMTQGNTPLVHKL